MRKLPVVLDGMREEMASQQGGSYFWPGELAVIEELIKVISQNTDSDNDAREALDQLKEKFNILHSMP